MKTIKRLARLIQIQYTLTRNGFSILSTFLKLLARFRFMNPLNWFRKKRSTGEDLLHKAADELKPILMKVGQTLSAQPEVLHVTLKNVVNKLHDIIPSAANEKTITIVEEPQEFSSLADTIPDIRTNEQATSELELKLKALFSELKSSHFTGNKAIHQIGTLIGKGLELTQQLNEQAHSYETQDIEAEWQVVSPPKRWGDFINDVDELSLSVGRLQAHVNQLMSCYEIN